LTIADESSELLGRHRINKPSLQKSNELLSAFESFIANQKLLVVINFKVSVYEKSRRILKREEYVSQTYI
jgi:hypothetical protein